MRASEWNNLVDYVRTLRILPSPNIAPTQTAFGTTLVSTNTPQKRAVGSSGCRGFQLYVVTEGEGEDITQQVWISAGTIGGQLPNDFDPVQGKMIADGGSGNVWAEITIDENTGQIQSLVIDGGAAPTPEDTNTTFYYTLGFYEYDQDDNASVSSYGCGSLELQVCRNWFAAEAPFYGVTLTRCECAEAAASE